MVSTTVAQYNRGGFGNYGTERVRADAYLHRGTTSTVNHVPKGSLDGVTNPAAFKIRVRGWAADPDVPKSAIAVHVYVDGKNTSDPTANKYRSDVARVYPAYGAYHGFDTTFAATPGNHQVCAYAINRPKGTNPKLGCKTLTLAKPPPAVPNSLPVGSFDPVTVAPLAIEATGWAADAEAGTNPLTVEIYADGQLRSSGSANKPRSTDGAIPTSFGIDHGFDFVFTLSAGQHTICARAVNVPAGTNPQLGCQTVNVPVSSTGTPNTSPEITGVTVGPGVVDGADPQATITYRDADCNVTEVEWEPQGGSPSPLTVATDGSCNAGTGTTRFPRTCGWSGTWVEYFTLVDARGNRSNRFAFEFRCDAPLPATHPTGCGSATVSTGAPTTLFFQNHTGAPVAIFWMNGAGQPVYYATLGSAPSWNMPQRTYIGHAWIAISRDGRCLGSTIADASDKTYVIG